MPQRVNEQIGSLPAIESEAHFFAVGLEMLRADFMPSPNNAALEQGKGRFDCVGVDVTLHVDSELVHDGLVSLVLSQMPRSAAILPQVVRHQHVYIIADVLADVLFERAAFYVRCMKETKLTLPLADANYHFLVDRSASALPVSTTANVGFVHLDCSIEHWLACFHHRRAYPVAQIPRCLVADSKRSLNLTSAHALLGFTEQVGRRKPLFEGQVGVVENRSGGHGELIAA